MTNKQTELDKLEDYIKDQIGYYSPAVSDVIKHAKLYAEIEPMLREMVEDKEDVRIDANIYFMKQTAIITKIATLIGDK